MLPLCHIKMSNTNLIVQFVSIVFLKLGFFVDFLHMFVYFPLKVNAAISIIILYMFTRFWYVYETQYIENKINNYNQSLSYNKI